MNAITKITPVMAAQDDRARLVRLAKSFASPVARGLLPRSIAESELLLAAVEARRAGEISVDPVDLSEILKHIFRLNLANLAAGREVAAWRIQRRVMPLVATQAPPHRVMAAAHDANDAFGFQLRRWEVHEIIVAAQMEVQGTL